MLETLVTDNEMLKRDGEELQRLLSESREEFRGLQEELDELRASENRKYSRHRSGSAKSSMQLPPLNLAPLSPRSIRSFSGAAGFTRLGKRAVSAERNLYVSSRNPFQFSILNQTPLFVRNPVLRPPPITGVGLRKLMPSPRHLDSYWSWKMYPPHPQINVRSSYSPGPVVYKPTHSRIQDSRFLPPHCQPSTAT